MPFPAEAAVKKTVKKEVLLTAKQLAGKILIQKESYNRPWYVNPKDGQRYYLNKGNMAFVVLRSLGSNIAAKDLDKIPAAPGKKGDQKLVSRLLGQILIPLNENDRIWYLNPANGIRYLLENNDSINSQISRLGKIVSNNQLKIAPMNQTQLAFDTTFNDVAFVKYDGENFTDGYNADLILPPASMTKLMTALVLIDQNLDWQKKVIISDEQIAYPATLSGGDKTSEIDFKPGDEVLLGDLLVSLLVASSNQSSVALADATGFSRREFISLMNKKALALGLKKTIFYDVSGLDSHNVTTPKEMAIMAQAAFAQPLIAQTTIINDYQIPVIDILGRSKMIEVLNRNKSLMQYEPDGVKTGFLVEAQRTVSLKKNGNIIVVMHALSMNQRNKIIEKLLK
jgi:hypothetical protein